MATDFYGNETTETAGDDFDIDLRLSAREDDGEASIVPFVSKGSNCSTCSHTTPHLCC